MSPLKQLLIDAIKGRGVPYIRSGAFESIGAAVFTGNQHNPSWEWNQSFLEKLSLDQLDSLYGELFT